MGARPNNEEGLVAQGSWDGYCGSHTQEPSGSRRIELLETWEGYAGIGSDLRKGIGVARGRSRITLQWRLWKLRVAMWGPPRKGPTTVL